MVSGYISARLTISLEWKGESEGKKLEWSGEKEGNELRQEGRGMKE